MSSKDLRINLGGISPDIFKNQKSYDEAKLIITAFDVYRSSHYYGKKIDPHKATVTIEYDIGTKDLSPKDVIKGKGDAWRTIIGEPKGVFAEASKYITGGEKAVLIKEWINAKAKNAFLTGHPDYEIAEPKELLEERLLSSNKSPKDVSKEDFSTLYKNISGTRELTRDKAIQYAKGLGVDPVDLLFNKLEIPVWGWCNLTKSIKYEYKADKVLQKAGVKKETRIFSSGQIAVPPNLQMVICPRDIFRPDVKAILITGEESIYNEMIAFYYNSTKISDTAINKLCVVGHRDTGSIQLGDHPFSWDDEKFYFGIYRIYGTKKILVNPDPNIPEKDPRHILVEDLKPTFVAPVEHISNIHNLERKENVNFDQLQKLGKWIRQEELNSIKIQKARVRDFKEEQQKERFRYKKDTEKMYQQMRDVYLHQQKLKDQIQDMTTRHQAEMEKNIKKKRDFSDFFMRDTKGQIGSVIEVKKKRA